MEKGTARDTEMHVTELLLLYEAAVLGLDLDSAKVPDINERRTLPNTWTTIDPTSEQASTT